MKMIKLKYLESILFDVWSAGCVLYELITLKRYFDQNKSNDDSFDNLNTKVN